MKSPAPFEIDEQTPTQVLRVYDQLSVVVDKCQNEENATIVILALAITIADFIRARDDRRAAKREFMHHVESALKASKA